MAVASVAGFIVLTSEQARARDNEDEPVIEAQLASEPEPEPEPEPPAKAEAPKPPPPKPIVKPPSEVPAAPLKEAEVDRSQLSDERDPFQRDAAPVEPAPEAPALEPAPVTPPIVKAPPRPEKKGPIRVTEEVTPPVASPENVKPEYPASAKARGVEGVVLVKYVVSETGTVSDAKVLKGPEELHAVCLAAVKSWRFRPALLDNQAVAVIRVARFPFTIKV